MAPGRRAAVQAWIGWQATEGFLRLSEPLPGLAIVVGLLVAAALVTIGMYA